LCTEWRIISVTKYGSIDSPEKNETEGKRNENTNTVSLLPVSDNLSVSRNCIF